MISPSNNGVISSVPPSPPPKQVCIFSDRRTVAQVSIGPLSDMWNGEAGLETPAHICIC